MLSSSKISFSRLKTVNTFTPASLSVPELLMAAAPTTLNGIPIQLPGLFAQFAGSGGLAVRRTAECFATSGDMSWTKGKHTIRFGGLYDYQQINYAFVAYAQATRAGSIRWRASGRSWASSLRGAERRSLYLIRPIHSTPGRLWDTKVCAFDADHKNERGHASKCSA
jgi:hypothetical protein